MLPNVGRLEAAIFDDMRETSPHGISWWSQLAPERRILIGDQLYACAQSISVNMVEARLHFLELSDWAERTNTRLATAINAATGEIYRESLRPSNAMDVLTRSLVSLHVAGVIRALSSALDCLAGTIIGVVAIPTNILKADFKAVRLALRRKAGDERAVGRSDCDALQARFSYTLDERIEEAGPPGWVDWMLDYRNMLVHRGRRVEIGQFIRHQVGRILPGTPEAGGLRAVQHLPRDPGRSDVEVHRGVEDPAALVLTEDAMTTVNGLVGSTVALVEEVAEELLVVWDGRRRNPDTLDQPERQWGSVSDVTGFPGYRPEEYPLRHADVAVMNPLLARRLRAASVLRRTRPERSGA